MQIVLEQCESPVWIVPQNRLSVEEFFAFSAKNEDLRMEMEPNGDLLVMSPSFGGTGFRNQYITRMLGNWADQEGSGFALDSNTGCLLPDGSVRSADAAWIRSSRWSPPSIEDDAPVPCPDFVIELRSKIDRLPPLQAKMRSWIENGCELAWLIDPLRKAVEIYRPGQLMEEQEGHSAVVGEGSVEGFVPELGKVWG